MELLSAVGKALVISLGMGAFILFLFLVIGVFTIRNRVQGRIWLEFVEPNGDIVGHLYKLGSDTVSVKNPDGSKTDYFVNPHRQFRRMYPPGFPAIMQEPVVAQVHIRGKAEPLALRDEKVPATADSTLKAIKTATILRNLTERAERVAQQSKVLSSNRIWQIMLVLATAGSFVAAWLVYKMTAQIGQMASQIDQILKILGG